MADTHYPHSYEIPRWVRPRWWRSSVPLQCNISRDPVPRIYVSAKRLLAIPLYPRPPPLRSVLPYPGRLPFSSSSLHCNHGNNHSSLSLAPLQSDCSLSFFLHFSHHLTDNPPQRIFSILPLPPLLLDCLCDLSSLSFYLRIHGGFQRNAPFYRCTDRKRNVFAVRSALVRCADGKGNERWWC